MKPISQSFATKSDQLPVASCVAKDPAQVPGDKQLDSGGMESGDSGLLNDESSRWTLLPRPPLSFVEARSELHKWTGKYQTSGSNEVKSAGSGLNNNEKCGANNIVVDIEGKALPTAEDKTMAD
jgi:hypothetical protein